MAKKVYTLLEFNDNETIDLVIHDDLLTDGTTWYYTHTKYHRPREWLSKRPIDPCYAPFEFAKLGLSIEDLASLGNDTRELVGLWSKRFTFVD